MPTGATEVKAKDLTTAKGERGGLQDLEKVGFGRGVKQFDVSLCQLSLAFFFVAFPVADRYVAFGWSECSAKRERVRSFGKVGAHGEHQDVAWLFREWLFFLVAIDLGDTSISILSRDPSSQKTIRTPGEAAF